MEGKPTYPKTTIFDFKLQNASIRYGIIVLLALVNAHIRAVNFIPYQFPVRVFLNGLMFGLLICSACWGVTILVKKPLFRDGRFSRQNIGRFLFSNLIVACAVYVALYAGFFNLRLSTNFFAYLFLTIAVVVIENLSYILYSHLRTLSKAPKQTLAVSVGSREKSIAIATIVFVKIDHGIVSIHEKNGRHVITGFKSIDAVEQLLPPADFFRVSRQAIVGRLSILDVKKETNRTLAVNLNSGEKLQVSRYRKKDFLTWYHQG